MPDEPEELQQRTRRRVLSRTVREFARDQCTDLAAGLTYYAVLASAPAALALVSVLGLVGDPEETAQRVLDSLGAFVPDDAMQVLEPIVDQVTKNSGGAGWAFIIGLVLAVWSASGYVSAFGRAMNRIYGVEEGRPIWKLRPLLVVLTLATIIIAAVVAAVLVLSGSVARSVGETAGVSDGAITVWNIVKWPVAVALVVILVALLYYATPNVKKRRFRWLSMGALVAIVVWALASVAFGFYVSNFASYGSTYGALAGVIVFLLWMWITNLALLFGAELDAELERVQQLNEGVPAEDQLTLPLRDTRAADKRHEKHQKAVEDDRALREAVAARTPPAERASDDGGGGAAAAAEAAKQAEARGSGATGGDAK